MKTKIGDYLTVNDPVFYEQTGAEVELTIQNIDIDYVQLTIPQVKELIVKLTEIVEFVENR